jgi:hypothetical protein
MIPDSGHYGIPTFARRTFDAQQGLRINSFNTREIIRSYSCFGRVVCGSTSC